MYKIIFFAILKPIVYLLIGINVVNKPHMKNISGCIIIANHNSHLDTIILLSLFKLSQINKIKPVAAADYFLSNWFMKWFSLNVIGILPISRKHSFKRLNFSVYEKEIKAGNTLIMYPEGTRGKPEKMQNIKTGLYKIISSMDCDVPIIPVLIQGSGRSLPKGSFLLVPFNSDIIIGEPITNLHSKDEFREKINLSFTDLKKHFTTKINRKDSL